MAIITTPRNTSSNTGAAGNLHHWAAASALMAAPFLFAASLIGFAAVRSDGYTHGTKAVSELGVIGAPHALAFNVMGFILPGVMMIFGALAFARAQNEWRGLMALTLAGTAFALAGLFPFDPGNPRAFTSQAHVGGAMLAGLFWSVGVFRGRALLARAGLTRFAHHGRWLVLALLVNIGWQVAFRAGLPILPGWGQRIGFAGMMIWLFWFGTSLWHHSTRKP